MNGKKLALPIICLAMSLNAFSQKRFITVDGTKIWINTIGIEERKEGQPVIVFESGYGTPMDHWDKILPGVSKLAPLFTYDRPGIGESDPDNKMPTIKNVSDNLVQILTLLKIEPPYILVGHSLGGVYVRGFANYYPDKLAGLIIIDPADFTEDNQNKREYYQIFGWDDKRIDKAIEEMNGELAKRNEGVPKSIYEEGKVLADLRESEFTEIKDHPLPNIPVHLITGGRFDFPEKLRSKEYDDEMLFRSKNKHRIARWIDVVQSVDKGMLFYSGDAGHFVHYDDPELVISSIRIALQDYQLLKIEKDKK